MPDDYPPQSRPLRGDVGKVTSVLVGALLVVIFPACDRSPPGEPDPVREPLTTRPGDTPTETPTVGRTAPRIVQSAERAHHRAKPVPPKVHAHPRIPSPMPLPADPDSAAAEPPPRELAWTLPKAWHPIPCAPRAHRCFKAVSESDLTLGADVCIYRSPVDADPEPGRAHLQRWTTAVYGQPTDPDEIGGEFCDAGLFTGILIELPAPNETTASDTTVTGVLLPVGDTFWAFELRGSRRAVAATREDFLRWVNSLR